MVVDREALGFGGKAAPELSGISAKERARRIDALKSACATFVQGRLLAALDEVVHARLPNEPCGVALDPADADGQTLNFRYPQSMNSGGYLKPVVKIELGARSDVEPTATPEILSYLSAFAPAVVGASGFSIRTVAPERTFWEKAMLLHEERLRAGDAGPKPRLSRHYYDLFRLLKAGVGARAADDLPLFERIAAHRAVYFPRNKAVRESLKRGTLSILPDPRFVAVWRQDYEAMRDSMFFGEPPTFDEILREIAEFERSFNESSASDASSP